MPTNPNLEKIIKLTQTQYNTLANGGTVGDYTGLNDNYLYLIQDNVDYLPLTGGTLTGTLTAGAINPSANNTYSLGTSSYQWDNIYGKTIYEDGVTLSEKYDSWKTTTNNVFRFRYLLNLLSGTNFNDIKGSFDTIRGNTVSWNQQVLNPKPTSITSWTTYGNTTISFENNSVRGVSSRQYDSVVPILGKSIIPGHKYLTSIDLKNNLSEVATLHYFNNSYGFGDTFNVEVSSTYRTYPILITASSNNSQDRIYIGNVTVNTDINYKNFYVLDLTQMFGSGNEPTSTNDPKVQWALDYAAKHPEANEGKIVNLLSPEDEEAGIDTVGFNLWDEQWEFGYWSNADGVPSTTITSEIRCKNFIEVSPNTTYSFNKSSGGTNAVQFYDANKNFMGYKLISSSSLTFTTPTNCFYIRFNFGNNYGTTYNHDICINLSNSAKNRTYEPHKHAFSKLDLSSIKDSSGNTLFPYGLCGIGTVHDEVSKFRAVKRIARVDLGTLYWTYNSDGFFLAEVPSFNGGEKVLCTKYQTISGGYSALNNNQIAGYGGITYHRVAIKDTSAGTDAAAFKTAMSGVILNFELAEPIIVETDWLQKQDYPAFADGSEEILSDTTMIDADITYSNDISVVFARVAQAISDGNESITLSDIQRSVQVMRYI